MLNRRFSRYSVALFLIFLFAAAPALALVARRPSGQAGPDLAARLEAIEKAMEKKREELGLPGFSLAIVKDDKTIMMKGFGLRDVDRKLPVTPDTLFAIGSCSKAFTAMVAMMSAEEGKLSLDDSPKKHLPYFKLQDAEADAKINVRDLLSHQSGLDGTDLAWYTGALTREEVIKVAGLAKPKAKLREKFQYQNVMYSAAGEVVARANNSTWEGVIANRFFKPLGMKSSDTSVKEMAKSSDYATGYDLRNKKISKAILRDLTNIAPAGAINSNARDMVQWLRLMLNGGQLEGKRLVSEKGYQELITKQIGAEGLGGYALGWGFGNWKGQKVLLHSGGIDGFNALVAFIPDQKLGFVLLSNVSGSPLLGFALQTVWSNLADPPKQETAAAPAPPDDPKSEVGSYFLEQANMTIEIKMVDGKLVAVVPGQPEYPLVKVEGRRYKLDAPAPDGFFMTFRPVSGREKESEMFLEQPQGNAVLPKKSSAAAAPEKKEESPALLDLLGKYEREGTVFEVLVKDDKVTLVVPGQPAYPLFERSKDLFGMRGLPDAYSAQALRGPDGKVSVLKFKQPEGEFEFKRVVEATGAGISTDELMAKVITAHGGEANLRKHKSMVVVSDLNFVNQGLTGEQVTRAQAPNQFSVTTTFIGLGKKIGTVREYFDGSGGGTEASFSNPDSYDDKRVTEARTAGDFYHLLNWKTLFKEVTVKRKSKVGDEEVYVVVKTPEKGSAVTDYVSAKTFLVVKRVVTREPLGSESPIPVSEIFSDYRMVDGTMVPFHTVEESAGVGTVIARVKEVKFDVAVAESAFRASAK